MGSGTSIVDNASSGGIFVGVNVETLELLGPGRDLQGRYYPEHPFTKYDFQNKYLPDGESIFRTAREAHMLCNSNMVLGWDIAMTPGGPSIIEGNTRWMCEVHTSVDSGFKDRLWSLFLRENHIIGVPFKKSSEKIMILLK